jgi:hypothetical protein
MAQPGGNRAGAGGAVARSRIDLPEAGLCSDWAHRWSLVGGAPVVATALPDEDGWLECECGVPVDVPVDVPVGDAGGLAFLLGELVTVGLGLLLGLLAA